MRECKIVSRKFDIPNSHTLEVSKANGGYRTLAKIDEYSPLEIIDIIRESKLRGKCGGGAPASAKWVLMPEESDKPSFLVVNCDESEPGTFKDRQIISKDPHLLIEGILITCYAIKAKHAYIYIRGEYKQFQDILQSAGRALRSSLAGGRSAGYSTPAVYPIRESQNVNLLCGASL